MSSLPADARSSLDAVVNQIGKNITGVEGRCQQRRGLDRLYETVKTKKGSYWNRFRQCWRAGRETSGKSSLRFGLGL